MSLSHAILVCLVDEPMTGYELAKHFDSSVGFFWRANHQQIYRELSALSSKGWVKGRLIAQVGRPNKTMFSVTKAGRAELIGWSRLEADPASIKEELMLRLYALPSVDVGALVEQIERRIEMHRQRLSLYELILDKHYRDEKKLDLAGTGRLLGLKAGLGLERTWILWCEEALVALARHKAQSTRQP